MVTLADVILTQNRIRRAGPVQCWMDGMDLLDGQITSSSWWMTHPCQQNNRSFST
jgi:hypothetical protein